MFRTVTRLALLDLGETIVLMPVEWRKARGRTSQGESGEGTGGVP